MEKIKFEIKDGVLYGPYPDAIELDIEKVERMVIDRLEFLDGQRLPALVDTTGIKQVTKEARDYMATSKATEGIVAAAILSKSKYSIFVSNFFIKISLIKSPIPIKIFSEESEALEWLEQFK